MANAYVNVRGGYHASPEPHSLVLNDAADVLLNADRTLTMSVRHEYRVVAADEAEGGPWRVSSSAYIYRLSEDDEPIFAYHWHPIEGFDIQFPHLHLYLLERQGAPALAKAHFPTARISLESFVRLLVREFGVRPLRDDYPAILDARERDFLRQRTWA